MRNLVSGIPSTNAAMSSRCTCGFCVVIQAVTSPVPGFTLARVARGSIALGISRWLWNFCFTVFAALLNASSVFCLSPSDHLKETLFGASLWSCGAPACAALIPSTTAGSGS